MHVRLTQIDGKLPNLALMKLAAWHRARGEAVHFSRSVRRDLFEPAYGRVYGSAIFAYSALRIERFRREFPEAIVSGSGTDPKGGGVTVEESIGVDPWSYEHYDYGIYPDFDASIGFSQRGCRLNCKFCGVRTKEGKPVGVNSIARIWRGAPFPRNIHLLDNDFFGQPDWRERIREIADGGFRVCLSQGINIRLIDDESAGALASIEYRDTKFQRRRLYTAWDNLKDEAVFFRGLDTLERAGIPATNVMAYMLIGFDPRETWERIWLRFNRMVARGVRPYPMVFDPDPHRRSDRVVAMKRFQRWAVMGLYRSVPWDEYLGSRHNDSIARMRDEGMFDGISA